MNSIQESIEHIYIYVCIYIYKRMLCLCYKPYMFTHMYVCTNGFDILVLVFLFKILYIRHNFFFFVCSEIYFRTGKITGSSKIATAIIIINYYSKKEPNTQINKFINPCACMLRVCKVKQKKNKSIKV